MPVLKKVRANVWIRTNMEARVKRAGHGREGCKFWKADQTRIRKAKGRRRSGQRK